MKFKQSCKFVDLSNLLIEKKSFFFFFITKGIKYCFQTLILRRIFVGNGAYGKGP